MTGQAQQLAQAHATRTAAETVHQQWHAPGLPAPARAVLGDLYQLYCLAQVEPHTGWLLARGLLDAADVLALPERADACCRRLTPTWTPWPSWRPSRTHCWTARSPHPTTLRR